MNNDDIVKPGTGFDTHPHRDMEIVTWVLRGSLVHQDSTGHSGVIYPGLAQRMSAGRGILHSEKNDSWTLTGEQSHSEPVHFVQMWVVPDESGITPGYQQLEIDDELLRGGLVTIASGMPEHSDDTAITIRNRYAACTARVCSPATASSSRRLPICTCSSPAVRSPSRAPDRCTKATPCGSPHPAVSASPPPHPRRFWSGRCMRVWLRRKRIGAALIGVVLVAACSTDASDSTTLISVLIAVPHSPLPQAWCRSPCRSIRIWPSRRSTNRARRWCLRAGRCLCGPASHKARLAAWAPDGSLLVSVPSSGQVVRLEPSGAGPRLSVPLDGLDQPHGLAFSGRTLYIAESDQIDAYDYADGTATNRRTAAAGLPDARSPDLRGAYAHALKSVAVGPDGAVYFSIGSTGNITANDRTANPPRATIMRIPPGGGPAAAIRDRRA